MSMWGGRFEGGPDPLFREINDSLKLDCRLVQQDIAGSIAWAAALEAAGVLTADETKRTVAALQQIAREAAGDPDMVAAAPHEDVHTWVEARLIERIGALGKKLHTGRSRNDQVATDLRLWIRAQIAERKAEIRAAQTALLGLAEREKDTVLPGYTHLQRAQPVLLPHWCLAYVEMLDRDHDRFADASKRLEQCPLGSGALAGTAWPIDRAALAAALGFAGPTPNSIDAVSSRDFVVEALAATALCGVHLSRFAEDMVFYASAEAGFVELPDAVTSGSSLMPQKKNPDALELIRGKAGRLIGSLVSILVTLKGLPLAYNKDLQEDKAPLFDAMESLSVCLRVIPRVLEGLRVNRAAAAAAAQGGFANATDLADYLVGKGVAFRDAHEITGRIVRHAIGRGVGLEQLGLEELRSHSPLIGPDIGEFLAAHRSLGRRDVVGGTAPRQVAEALRHARQRLGLADPSTGRTVRQAVIDDVDGICRIVDHWARQGENLPRSRSNVIETIHDFGVAVGADGIVGCGALHVYTPLLAEIRSLGVVPHVRGGGTGSDLVRYLIGCARALHLPRVFVLTRARGFFERLGFRVESIESFPEKVWKDCSSCPKQNNCDEVPMVYEVTA